MHVLLSICMLNAMWYVCYVFSRRFVLIHAADICVKHPYFNSVAQAHVFSFVWKVSNRLDLSALSRLCHTRLQLSRHCDLHLKDGATGRHFDKATAHILFTHIWTSRQFLAEQSSNTRELEDAVLFEIARED